MIKLINQWSKQVRQRVTLLCLLGCLCLANAFAQADKLPVSGVSGTCSWVLDTDGVLSIKPEDGLTEGKLGAWNADAPWHDYAADIRKVVVSGVVRPTTCQRMLADCSRLAWIDFSGMDFTDVGSASFEDMYSNAHLPYVMVFPAAAKEQVNKLVPTLLFQEERVCQVVNENDQLWNPRGIKVKDVQEMVRAFSTSATTTFVRIGQLEEREITVKLGIGWSTLCYPYDVTLREESTDKRVDAFRVTGVDDKGVLTLQQLMDEDSPAESLPAFTPVLLYAEDGATLCAVPDKDGETVKYVSLAPVPVWQEDNLLVGVNGDASEEKPFGVTISSRNQYVLQKHGTKVAFYYVDKDNAKDIVPYRCYLEMPSSPVQLSAFYVFPTNTKTGILHPTSLDGEQKKHSLGMVYDLNGRVVKHLQKGKVYISDGMKIIIK